MFKKMIIGIVCLFFIIGCLNGCSSSGSDIEQTANQQLYNYTETLGNGLTFSLTAKTYSDIENAILFERSFDFDSGTVSVDESTLQEDSGFYLVHKTSGEIIELDLLLYYESIVHHFDDNVELSDYTLHVECPLVLEFDSSYSVDINLNDSQAEAVGKIELPLDNYIEINEIATRTGYDKFSDKCVDISFSTSGNVANFDIWVEQSEISTGAAAGDLEVLSSTDYIYTHPVTDTEQNIIISFVDIGIRDNLNCDIA